MSLHFHDSMTTGNRGLRLRAGLLIYHGPGGVAVMAHDVRCQEGDPQPEMISGFPLHRDQAQVLAHGILGHAPVRTLLPPAVLLADGFRLAWWTPARRRRIWFSARELQHVSRQEVMHPALLWVADPGRLHLYALASDARPELETPVYQAPYLNTYADGWVCAGGVQWPPTVQPDTVAAWEQAMHDSEGTHCVASDLTLYPGGHDALWEAMLTAERFPADSLVPTKLTVLDAINRQGASVGGPMMRERALPEVAAALGGDSE